MGDMHWQHLSNLDQLKSLHDHSHQKKVVVFKHSTRCSISSMALARLERQKEWGDADFFLLDLIQHRTISNALAEQYQVHHESPQVLLIHHGECVYDESHNGITAEELNEQLAQD